jgi:hypothetical protein
MAKFESDVLVGRSVGQTNLGADFGTLLAAPVARHGYIWT